MIIRPRPPFSRTPWYLPLLSCTHVYAYPEPSDTYSFLFFCAGRTLILFAFPLSFSLSLSLSLTLSPAFLCAIVYAWKLEVPRCPAAARGVSWQKCNAAYHKICSRCRLREKEGGGGLYVTRGCTVWFGSTAMVVMKDSSERKVNFSENAPDKRIQ